MTIAFDPKTHFTVKELRKALEGAPDDMPVCIKTEQWEHDVWRFVEYALVKKLYFRPEDSSHITNGEWTHGLDYGENDDISKWKSGEFFVLEEW